ncbi:DUF7344 domain-containing protein [Halorussus marinus]|uniref:DUF7344 domain-containing protein n=1 Tax=Halorussus marinus TaxID=2505976 RepID=UPI00106EC41E|nr:ArsR family transcriptional regulator [Halorussus marinus]
MSGAVSGTDSGTVDGDRSTARPSRDAMFDLLGNARRRRTLRHLLDESRISITDLSARIAAWENDTTVEAVSGRQRKQVYSSLYQTHVPRLDDHGLARYDADDRVVELTGDAAYLRRFLDVTEPARPRDTRRWSRYFFLTAVVGSAVIAGHWLGTTPATHLATEDLYGLLTVAFMMLSVSFVMAVEGRKILQSE